MPDTAARLLAAVRPFGPGINGANLTFTSAPPPALVELLAVLHTGVRAALADRPWYGCGSTKDTAAPARVLPAALIPPGVTLLCVEGDARWHRIPPAARAEFPALFAAEPKPKAAARRAAG